MQSAENEFGALHEWINKHLSDDLSLAMLAALGSALECRLLALSGHRLLARIGSSRDRCGARFAGTHCRRNYQVPCSLRV